MNLKNIEVKALSSEEIANSLTHAIGVVLSIIGAIALLMKAYNNQDSVQIFSAYIFCCSLLLLYSASTIYHALTNPKPKEIFHLIDHTAIFILIAGTYTPFLLVSLREEIHISFFIIMWSIAAVGIIYKIFMIKKLKLFSTLIYLAMGWMAILKIKTFYQHLPWQASIWIFVGGTFYSIGTIFYSVERIRYHHAIWHFFVLCGSVSHFIAIYLYVY